MIRQLRSNRRQGGFIQGTILFALAILGVIVAAFAVSNTGSSTNTDTERDRVNAGVVLKAGSDLQDSVSRALADNHLAANITLAATGTAQATGTTAAILALYDPAYRYGVEPRLPDQGFTAGAALQFAIPAVTGAVNSVGGAANELRVELPGLRLDVCRRIMNLVAGGAYNATALPPADHAAAAVGNGAPMPSEGCYGTGTGASAAYTYYRVVAVDAL